MSFFANRIIKAENLRTIDLDYGSGHQHIFPWEISCIPIHSAYLIIYRIDFFK